MAFAGVVAFALLLVLAPPASNAFWAVNAFRSLTPFDRTLLVIAALAGGAIPLFRTRGRAWLAGSAMVFAGILAFPLHERTHFLGDTASRIGAISIHLSNLEPRPWAEWARQIHAQPFDFAINFLVPVGLARLGWRPETAISLASWMLGIVYLAGIGRVASRLAPPDARAGVCAALALSGLIQAFAGYVESAGVLLASAAWWWAALLGPIGTRRDALLATLAWLGVCLSHRVGGVMLLPQLWRAFGPPLAGDEPRARRDLLVFSVVAAALGAGLLVSGGGGAQIARDLRELFSALGSRGGRLAAPIDVANLLVLIAPLALLAPLLAAWSGARAFFKRPEARLVLVAALPLVPIAIQVGASGLGLHRDWDLNVLLGWTLTLGGATMLVRLPAPALRGALATALPVLALISLGWVAVNASEPASLRRAEALAAGPPALEPSQRAQVLLYIASWSMDRGRAREAAGYYERSYDLAPTPNRGLLAGRAWMLAGDITAAERMLTRVRKGRGFDARSRELADTLESQMARRKAGAGGAR